MIGCQIDDLIIKYILSAIKRFNVLWTTIGSTHSYFERYQFSTVKKDTVYGRFFNTTSSSTGFCILYYINSSVSNSLSFTAYLRFSCGSQLPYIVNDFLALNKLI